MSIEGAAGRIVASTCQTQRPAARTNAPWRTVLVLVLGLVVGPGIIAIKMFAGKCKHLEAIAVHRNNNRQIAQIKI